MVAETLATFTALTALWLVLAATFKAFMPFNRTEHLSNAAIVLVCVLAGGLLRAALGVAS